MAQADSARPSSSSVAHHELCFGCGQANLLGLQIEAAPESDGRVAGRFFLKQDHQGPNGGAHAGVLAAALEEAMALTLHAAGIHAAARRIEVDLHAAPPVGTFVRVEAAIEAREGRDVRLGGAAFGVPDGGGERTIRGNERRLLAEARGSFAWADPVG